PRSLARGDFARETRLGKIAGPGALTLTLVGVVSVVPEAHEQSTAFFWHRVPHPLCCKRLREIEDRGTSIWCRPTAIPSSASLLPSYSAAARAAVEAVGGDIAAVATLGSTLGSNIDTPVVRDRCALG
ncbi:unnamed protein product, partial [Ectocarpus sp. 13 AM-2016]